MKVFSMIGAAALLLGAALMPAPGFALPHPWPMENGDAQNTGQSLNVAPRTKPFVAWQIDLDAASYSRPVLSSGGIVYATTSGGKVFAASSTGQLQWIFDAGSPIYASAALGDDGMIYVASLNRTLHALNPNGTVKWAFDTGGENFVPPLVGSDDSVFVCSRGGFYRLNADGQLIYDAPLPTFSQLPISFAVASDNEVVLNLSGSRNRIVRLRNDGSTAWTWEPDDLQDPSNQVSLGSNAKVYVQHFGAGQQLVALDAATGVLLDQATSSTNDQFGFSLGLDNSVYATTGAGVEHYSPALDLLWTAPPTSYQVGGPVLDAAGTGLMSEGQTGYELIAFDTATGATLWELTAPNAFNLFNVPIIGPSGDLYATSASVDGAKGYLYGLAVPEPSSVVLAGIGTISLFFASRRRGRWNFVMKNLTRVTRVGCACLLLSGALSAQEQSSRVLPGNAIHIGQAIADAERVMNDRHLEFGKGGFAISKSSDDVENLFCVLDKNHASAAIVYSKSKRTVTGISLAFSPNNRGKAYRTWLPAKSILLDEDGSYAVHFLPPETEGDQQSQPKRQIPRSSYP